MLCALRSCRVREAAAFLCYRLDGVSGAAPLRFCRLRGPRRVRGAALRPCGLMLSCAGARTLKRLSQVWRSHNAAVLVGKNRSAKELFRARQRRPPPGTARERSEGSDERWVGPGSHLRPREQEAAPASRDRRGAPRAAPRRRSVASKQCEPRTARRRALHCSQSRPETPQTEAALHHQSDPMASPSKDEVQARIAA